jgi:hypothetical protein
VTDCIDDTEQKLREEQIMDDKYISIGKGIRQNALYMELT